MMMTTRRTLLATAFAGPLLAGTMLAGTMVAGTRAHAADAASSTAFVDAMLRELLAVVNGPGALAAKRAQLSRIVQQRVDVEAVARFCLGRFWRMATPQQQSDYVALFQDVLVKNVTGNLGEYQGVTYTLDQAVRRPIDFAVPTIVNRPGNAPSKVEWVVDAEGPPMVIDVIAEGTSLRLTQRSDYSSFISRNGNSVQALIDALRRQAATG